jgi:iron(II)-dependent oxidoreductase
MSPSLPAELAERLTEARARTLLLIAPVSEDDLHRQHDPLMSPILWDLGHIVHFEELWLTRNVTGPIEFTEMPGMYNPFEHPRATRAALPLPSLAALLAAGAEIRREVFDVLARADFHSAHPLLADAFVYRMVLQHEYQHDETILQTLQLKHGAPYAALRADAPPGACDATRFDGMVRVEAGDYPVGTSTAAGAYDNERPCHRVHLDAFEIDAAPVTNAAYLEFMADGGYTRRELWSPSGWRWVDETGTAAPRYWRQTAGGWTTRSMDRVAPPAPDHPVIHVCHHEADAFARWAGKRLPTELEWEVAASWDPEAGAARSYPWGDEPPTPLHANVDQLTFGTAPVGAYPRNVSPLGCYGMIGDAWEWTSSDFHAYPGFRPFPYPEYSEVFFGPDYKVLRGGSWATRPGAIRNTFRNWDFPIRRQIFSGFRCARDV